MRRNSPGGNVGIQPNVKSACHTVSGSKKSIPDVESLFASVHRTPAQVRHCCNMLPLKAQVLSHKMNCAHGSICRNKLCVRPYERRLAKLQNLGHAALLAGLANAEPN